MTWIQRVQQRALKNVNGGATFVACLTTVALSGYFAVTLTSQDQGKLVTLEEMQTRMTAEAQRIKDDPHMPPQAKRAALNALGRATASRPFNR